MFKLRQVAALAIVAGCVAASGASASGTWPAKIVGTWKGLANQSPIVLTVSTQTTGGKCQTISGTIHDVQGDFTGNMLGYYCPSSGAVSFLRYPTDSNVAYQVYFANLSQSPAPKGLGGIMMAGTFSQYSLTFGPLGQYSVSLFK
jgi:hypothetical protein